VPSPRLGSNIRFLLLPVASLLIWGALSDERTGLRFAIAAGPRQRSHSRVRVPRDSCPYFTVSDSMFPLSEEPGPRIYIPHEQGGPVISLGNGFPFRRLLRLAGLRWRYSNPPPLLMWVTWCHASHCSDIARLAPDRLATPLPAGVLWLRDVTTVTAVSLAPQFRLSAVMSQYYQYSQNRHDTLI
jgi:hypothetical protein